MSKFVTLLKATGWAILELIIFLVIGVIIGTSISGILYVIIKPDPTILGGEDLNRPYLMTVIEYAPLLIGALVSLYLTHHKIFKRPLATTGFQKTGFLREIGLGYALAFALLLVGFILLWMVGYIEISKIDWRPNLFFGFILFFLIQSSLEEVISRAFMIPSLTHRFNPIVALVISSSIFAIVHMSNPNVTIISLLNICMAGVLMGLLFMTTERIWMPIGLHAGWNFLQGSFFGFEVSGYDVYSLIDSKEVGPDMITGGAFGFEGSLLSLLLLTVVSAYIIKKNPTIFIKKISIESERVKNDMSDDITVLDLND